MSSSIERAREGDTAATAALVKSLRPRLEKMAAYYARRCGEDPDDLLQEAWIGLLDALPSLNLRIGRPEQYLLKRAKWRLLDSVKRARVRRCVSLDGLEWEQAVSSAPDEAPDAASARAFVQALKPAQRAVLECLLDGLTWRETGSVLGCTSANVAYYVRQIKRRYDDWVAGGR
jgi:RNA polymerase sigma factor (sigma-70 family)